MNRLRKLCVVLVVSVSVALLSMGGCNPNATTTITPEVMKQYADQVAAGNQQLTDLEAQAKVLSDALKQTGVMDPNAQAKMNKIMAEMQTVQSRVDAVVQAIATAKYDATATQAQMAVDMARAGNAASTPFNPYSAPIEAGLGLVSVLLGLFAKKKADDAKTAADDAEANRLKYEAHKVGVEKFMKEVSGSEDTAPLEVKLYDNIAQARANLGVK